MPAAEPQRRRRRMQARRRAAIFGRETRRSCAVLLPARQSARTRSLPPPPWSLPVQLTLHDLLKKIACQHQRGSAGAELRAAAGRVSQDGSHRLGGNAKNLGELSCDHLEGNLIVW